MIIDFFQIFGILLINKDELKIIYKDLHNSLDNNINIEDGIPSVPKVCVIISLLKNILIISGFKSILSNLCLVKLQNSGKFTLSFCVNELKYEFNVFALTILNFVFFFLS